VSKRIVIIQGHPDPAGKHFGHALAAAYGQGATAAGHELKHIAVAELDFPLLRTKEDWEDGEPLPTVRACQEAIAWADHLVIIYPLWLGTMPALLKSFFEQALRPGFAIDKRAPGKMWNKLLKGKSARVVVSMGMPAFLYRWYFRAHSLKSLERNILTFCGIGPVRTSIIGMVEGDNAAMHQGWLDKLRALGGLAR
jgi:putative NADPH-quinone reductase